MTIEELQEQLQMMIDDGVDPMTEVQIAQQPSWPLAGRIENVRYIGVERDSDERGAGAAWIASGAAWEYAPKRAWVEAWEEDE